MRWCLQAVLADGRHDFPGSPYVQAIEAPDWEFVDYVLPVGELWSDLPLVRLGLLQGLVLWTEQTLAVRLYRQTDGHITLFPDGRLVLWNTAIRLDTLAPCEVVALGQATRIRALAVGVSHEAPP